MEEDGKTRIRERAGGDKPPGVCRIREVVSVVQFLTTKMKFFTTLGRKNSIDFNYPTNTYNIGTGTQLFVEYFTDVLGVPAS
jgi:hypothetical protein